MGAAQQAAERNSAILRAQAQLAAYGRPAGIPTRPNYAALPARRSKKKSKKKKRRRSADEAALPLQAKDSAVTLLAARRRVMSPGGAGNLRLSTLTTWPRRGQRLLDRRTQV